MVYLVGYHSGDDACGGFNLYGVYTTPELALAASGRAATKDGWSPGWVDIVEIPLDTFGWFGYTDNKFSA